MKLTLLLSLLILVAACESKKTGVMIISDMQYSEAFEAYSENPLTKDGKTMMDPVKGTIARGYLPHHYGNTYEEAERAGNEIQNPFQANEKILARGKFLFENYCVVCHGELGKGDGVLIPRFPNPPSFVSRSLLKYPDGRLYNAISSGYGMMKSYAMQILPEDRWAIVFHIRKLQEEKLKSMQQ